MSYDTYTIQLIQDAEKSYASTIGETIFSLKEHQELDKPSISAQPSASKKQASEEKDEKAKKERELKDQIQSNFYYLAQLQIAKEEGKQITVNATGNLIVPKEKYPFLIWEDQFRNQMKEGRKLHARIKLLKAEYKYGMV